MISTYRTLHTNPERGHDQPRTHDLLHTALQKIGYTTFIESKLAPTSVIAVLETGKAGPTIALRAEMDALGGVTEPAAHDPRSSIPNVMHACGHDAHAAMLLGVADILWHNRGSLAGRVVLLFQPAEEVRGGADEIVAERILQGLRVSAIFSQHATPGSAVGTLSVSPGATLAGSTSFKLSVDGTGSHVAQPFAGADVPQALASIVAGLPDIVARRIDIVDRPTVMSVSYLAAGDTQAINRIAPNAIARGSIRSFERIDSSRFGASLSTLLQNYVSMTAAAHGASGMIEFYAGSPPLTNDSALFAQLLPLLKGVWVGTLDTSPYRGMFAEDFAYYTAEIPSLYFGWGVAKDGLGMVGVHQDNFTISPDAFDYGVRFFTLLAQLATTQRAELK